MSAIVKRKLSGIHQIWLAWQVELFGMYSLTRLKNFDAYSRSRSVVGVILVCVCAPIPCVVLLLLVDCAPLAPPEAGPSANYVHWVRNYFVTVLFSYTVLVQLLLTARGIPLTTMRLHIVATVSTLAAVAFEGLMASIIGFPLPFTLLFGSVVWMIANIVMLWYCLGEALRANEQTRIDTGNSFFVAMSQIVMTMVYPLFLYGFTQVDPSAQKFYILLLPIIKIMVKNSIFRFMGELDDLKPMIMIFTVELFNSLYVSTSMQQSSTISATLVVAFVDWMIAISSFWDLSKMHDEVRSFMVLIPKEHGWHGKNFVEVALCVLEEDSGIRKHATLREACLSSGRAMYTLASFKQASLTPKHDDTASVRNSSHGNNRKTVKPNSSATIIPVTSATGNPKINYQLSRSSTAENRTMFQDRHERLRFVRKTVQLLYTSECAVLLQYVAFIVPAMYSAAILIEYHLKNRPYYMQLADIDTQELSRRTAGVVLYGILELVAFVVMSFMLKTRLRIPTFKQLSFVLEKQWTIVQAKFALSFFYVVQNSVKHFGADFSFQFAWLKKKT